MKTIATVGEVDKMTSKALTGYPDGQAAWLQDDDTVRVAYQSNLMQQWANKPMDGK